MADNSVNNKRIAKNTFFLYLRMFLVLIVSLFTVRIVLKTLDVVDYGIYSAVGGVVLSLSFISSVLSNASQRFFSFELGRNNPENLKKILSTMLVTYIGVSVLIIIIIETVGVWFLQNKMTIPSERMDAALVVLQFSLASFVVSLMGNPYQAMIIAHEDMSVYAYVSIFDVFLRLGIVFLLVLFPVDKLILYAGLLFGAQLCGFAIYFFYCRKKYSESHIKLVFDREQFKSIFSFSSWTLFGSLAYMFNSQGINIILNMFFGPVVNAAYSVGNQVKTHVNQFSSNFYSAIRPPMVKSFARGDYDYMNKLFYFSSKTIFALLFVIIVPIFVETNNLLVLWLGTEKPYMVEFVRLMLIYGLILAMNDPFTTIAQAAGKVKLYHGVIDGFTILTLPVTYIFFKFGSAPEYAFYVSIVVFIIAHFLRMVILKRVVPFSIWEYSRKILIPIAVVITIITLLSYLTLLAFPGDDLWSTLSVCVVTFLFSGVSVFFILLNRDERMRIIDMFAKKLKMPKRK